ncbi:MAG: hypothetical protein JF586_08490 [Burkholderiales bacterium]|nr:hypothetical protein [Burkholderiales bacterium]
MKLVRFVVFAAAALAAMAAQATATFALHVEGDASVWSLWDGSGTAPWRGTLLIETPDGADGTYFNPRVAFGSNLALTDFDTASEPFPDEEIWVTVQGGKATSISGAWIDGDVSNGWWSETYFNSGVMTEEYFNYFNWIQATGAVSPVDEPAGIVLVLAGLVAIRATGRRQAARARPALA